MRGSLQYHAMVGAAYVLAGLSILACGYYGFLLGQGGFEGGLYALMFACFDTVKFNLPTVAEASFEQRRYGRTVIAWVMFSALCAASLFCEIGIYATTVAHNTAPGLAAQERYRQAVDERNDLERRIASMSAADKSDAEASLKKLQLDKLYNQTKACTDATLPESRVFCQQVEEARGKAGKAEAAEALRARLDQVKGRLSEMDLGLVTTSATPQVDTIAATMAAIGLSINKDAIPNMLAILIAALMETAAVIFYLMGSRPQESAKVEPQQAAPKKPAPQPAAPVAPADSVALWVQEATARSKGSLPFAAIKQDHAAWAREHGHDVASDTKLGISLKQMGFEREKVGGRIHYRGLRLVRNARLKVVGGE